ncbi:MAG TPA: HRDC domain-containing protein [Solirubrobacteraceae bacterium]|nr:HRDC domain-containing protein [Solirubrobacteraceae bacterium]
MADVLGDTGTLANSADVRASAALARRAGRLGIDTEFMSEGRYRALLCLTQVAVEDPEAETGIRTILIDGLDDSVDTTPLAELLADPTVEIILHAGRQDVAILRRAWRTEINHIFDTQIAAGFAGESAQSGYGNLLGSILGLKVAKSASYTRWDARPLTAEQLHYAAEDVAHLMQLADELQARLRTSDREEWAREECRRLEGVSDERDPDMAWERLPRVSSLDPKSRAVARRLAAWRERSAAHEDRPVNQLLQDQTLVEVAKRHPQDFAALGQIRGIHPSVIKRRGEAIISAVREGMGDEPIPRESRGLRTEGADAPLIALAEALLRSRAMEAGLAYELIASRAELEQIIAAARQSQPEPDVRTLKGWRRELVGEDLEALLSGRTALAVEGRRRLGLHAL